MSIPQGFKEVNAPELFKFEKKGASITGVLMRAKMERIKGDDVLELYISTGERVVRIRPGFDLRAKLNRSMIGKVVYIEYYGDDASKGKEDNPLKVFNVGVKEKPSETEEGDPGITDDDIPF